MHSRSKGLLSHLNLARCIQSRAWLIARLMRCNNNFCHGPHHFMEYVLNDFSRYVPRSFGASKLCNATEVKGASVKGSRVLTAAASRVLTAAGLIVDIRCSTLASHRRASFTHSRNWDVEQDFQAS